MDCDYVMCVVVYCNVENEIIEMNKRIVILGGGESGVGAALLAKQKGYDVFLSDGSSLNAIYRNELEIASVDFEENGHSADKILAAEIIIKSPGISEKNEMVKLIRAKGISIISEIEFAYYFIGSSKIIAITGSNGKTTTAALTFHICNNAGTNCALVGNIGTSFARQVAKDPKKLYIVEVSSFQLDDIEKFKPNVAILTNITEDHLDRYEYKFENYIHSKFKISMNQTKEDSFIYCLDDEIIVENIDKFKIEANLLPISMKKETLKGAFIKDGDMYVRTGNEYTTMSVFDFALQGKHNQYNTMAACVAAATLDLRKEKIREAVTSFQNLEHRMERVATVRGVEFINDIKATNVNSTWYALESMIKPTILIIGGVDKGNDYSLITELIKEKVKAVVCLGVENSKIHTALSNITLPIVNVNSADEAVSTAFHLAHKGDVVLLSPACASFDLFKNYEDRGNQFKQAVRDL